MKRYIHLTIAIMLAVNILCGVFAIDGHAQTTASAPLRAEIPFAFTVGEKSLPAGVYTVRILNYTSDRKTLQIRSENGRVSAMVQTLGVSSALSDDAKLVFHRYGQQYFFAQAQMAGETTSLAATKTRAERATQRAMKRPDSNTVVAIVAH
jgi:hypothetical protein